MLLRLISTCRTIMKCASTMLSRVAVNRDVRTECFGNECHHKPMTQIELLNRNPYVIMKLVSLKF